MTDPVGLGRCYLVGAGPGDRKLLTLRAAELLESADLVLHDALVGPGVLQMIPRRTERVYVGKRGGVKPVSQDETIRRMIEAARAGQQVVRLKGGDPFLLGRGAEEAEALAEAGIPFEVVPGVSSVTAVPAYAGIPLTDRRWSSSLTVVTGHEIDDKPQDGVPWERIASSAQTLVVLMGLTALARITEKLIAGGLAADTPAAVIQWGTLPQQRCATGTLADIVERAQAAQIGAPAITIVGQVAGLRDKLSWFEKRPLLGRRVVVTRARHQAGAMADALEALGAEPVLFPVITQTEPESWEPADRALRRLNAYDWVLFTSVNAVDAFMARLRQQGRDLRDLARAKLAAIGPGTAAALEALHLRPDLLPEDNRAEGLLAALVPLGIAGRRFLLPRAAEAREILPDTLRQEGAEIDVVPVYRTLPTGEGQAALAESLAAGEIDVVSFTSASTVHAFAALFDRGLLQVLGNAKTACIGPVTADALTEYGVSCNIMPERYAIPELVAAIAQASG